MKALNKNWCSNLIEPESCDYGKSQHEIDESKVVNINYDIKWMFGICALGTFDIRKFYVNNNRTIDTLLPLVKIIVYTYPLRIVNNHDENDYAPSTRIFSD